MKGPHAHEGSSEALSEPPSPVGLTNGHIQILEPSGSEGRHPEAEKSHVMCYPLGKVTVNPLGAQLDWLTGSPAATTLPQATPTTPTPTPPRPPRSGVRRFTRRSTRPCGR